MTINLTFPDEETVFYTVFEKLKKARKYYKIGDKLKAKEQFEHCYSLIEDHYLEIEAFDGATSREYSSNLDLLTENINSLERTLYFKYTNPKVPSL